MTTHWRQRIHYRPVKTSPSPKPVGWIAAVVGAVVVLVALLAGCQTAEGVLRMRLTSDLNVACREANEARDQLIIAMSTPEGAAATGELVEEARDASALAARRCGGVDDTTELDDLRMRITLVEEATADMQRLAGEFAP